jgi:hypothetical protein
LNGTQEFRQMHLQACMVAMLARNTGEQGLSPRAHNGDTGVKWRFQAWFRHLILASWAV